ncbi:uncharacterized protein EI90DRAFT_3068523 [Cantharellus anzutake]|uniref:uncharacterized protein n=1 Tax=Cantharellus anzutake TaxID=1750568 RepID=UPI001903E040|nr:uncharacterized protein EI90DRAFT_3068523 [Cantharellus anzutake]KAF8327273.1 hypothetical protein EI90DRAFT_3068523 [Cantharellus anzutake]
MVRGWWRALQTGCHTLAGKDQKPYCTGRVLAKIIRGIDHRSRHRSHVFGVPLTYREFGAPWVQLETRIVLILKHGPEAKLSLPGDNSVNPQVLFKTHDHLIIHGLPQCGLLSTLFTSVNEWLLCWANFGAWNVRVLVSKTRLYIGLFCSMVPN